LRCRHTSITRRGALFVGGNAEGLLVNDVATTVRSGNIKIRLDVTCLQITVGVYEQIFRFQVAIDDFEEVQIFE
jgi:hypothetical protein